MNDCKVRLTYGIFKFLIRENKYKLSSSKN